jgi:hypothetical protein
MAVVTFASLSSALIHSISRETISLCVGVSNDNPSHPVYMCATTDSP